MSARSRDEFAAGSESDSTRCPCCNDGNMNVAASISSVTTKNRAMDWRDQDEKLSAREMRARTCVKDRQGAGMP